MPVGVVTAGINSFLFGTFNMSFFSNFRNFAPKFQAISERITATVADLNLEHNNKYPKITFSAVDCVEHRKLCEKYEIQAYPTVLPFNFPTMKSKITCNPLFFFFSIQFIFRPTNSNNRSGRRNRQVFKDIYLLSKLQLLKFFLYLIAIISLPLLQ
jgi:hypothetical protein